MVETSVDLHLLNTMQYRFDQASAILDLNSEEERQKAS